jgi:hypothetical protein
MGLGIGFSSGRSGSSRQECNSYIQPPNPNPFKHKVINRLDIGDFSILLVKYEGCTTYGGYKLLLCRDYIKNAGLDNNGGLDPHILGKGHMVIARFAPTEDGLEMAKCSAIYMKDKLSSTLNTTIRHLKY